MKCSKCSEPASQGDGFCSHCGNNLVPATPKGQINPKSRLQLELKRSSHHERRPRGFSRLVNAAIRYSILLIALPISVLVRNLKKTILILLSAFFAFLAVGCALTGTSEVGIIIMSGFSLISLLSAFNIGKPTSTKFDHDDFMNKSEDKCIVGSSSWHYGVYSHLNSSSPEYGDD